MGALSVVATRDELIRGGPPGFEFDEGQTVDSWVANTLSSGVYPPLFHKFRQRGIFVIRFFKNFQWRYVLIDNRIPVERYSNEPIFGSCNETSELWVALIEKAYAKMVGCY